MTTNWLSGATRVPSDHDGGSLIEGPRRMTWHTFEAPYTLTAKQGAQSLIRAGNEAHFVLHPWGGLVQLLPANRAARCLRNLPGGVQTNRLGTVHLQVEVVGYAKRPFTSDLTSAGRRDLARLITFCRANGIPDDWPAGPPPRYPGGTHPRGTRTWLHRAGHYGHSEVPENDHGDPGAIDTRVLFQPLPQPEEIDMSPMYVRTSTGTEGYLAVTPLGVHRVTAAEWFVLKMDPSNIIQEVSPQRWTDLADLADRTVDVGELAAAIVALLPPLPPPSLSAAEIANEFASRLQA